MIKTLGYKCSFCNKMSVNAGSIGLHEKRCPHNPINKRLCFDCVHYHDEFPANDIEANLQRPYEIILHHEECPGCGTDLKMKNRECAKKKVKLYFPNPYKEDWRTTIEDNNFVPMPSYAEGCKDYEKAL